MREEQFTIGVDFGTLSCRAALVGLRDGREIALSTMEYPHGVMDTQLPGGRNLPAYWSLQHPQDYLDTMAHTVRAVLLEANIDPGRIAGLGLDCTANTVLPVKKDGTPLCFLEEYKQEPHAYAKLWKHHAAQSQATRMQEIAAQRGETFPSYYGGHIASEWTLPKAWELLEEAPAIFEAMDYWIEAADWIAWRLTGELTRNACCAGFKACYHKAHGYPSKAYMRALDERLENFIQDKLAGPVLPPGAKAGRLTKDMAHALGLPPGIAVAAPVIDAHVCMPAAGIDGPGKMLAILGTSACYMLLAEHETHVPGICAMVEDGIMPGYIGYEAGLSCMGDHYAWVVEHVAGEKERAAAREQGISVHALLTEQAEKLRPGQSGLLALDWWNGNRSILVDAHLTGLLVGMTLHTTASEIYRALLEASAFGTRVILDAYRQHGVAVDEFRATGGISQKNALLMQIFADVLQMPVQVVDAAQGGALGSAIYAAVASKAYETVQQAARAMGRPCTKTYHPIAENREPYERLYQEYVRLYRTFGQGENDVMKRLLRLKHEQSRAGE